MAFPSGAAAVHRYSAQFFDLTPLSLFDRPVLELGRFAIDRQKGNSDVFSFSLGRGHAAGRKETCVVSVWMQFFCGHVAASTYRGLSLSLP